MKVKLIDFEKHTMLDISSVVNKMEALEKRIQKTISIVYHESEEFQYVLNKFRDMENKFSKDQDVLCEIKNIKIKIEKLDKNNKKINDFFKNLSNNINKK